MERIKIEIETRIKTLEDKSQETKNELADRLNKLLEDERMRNARLLRKYTRLKMRYEDLQRVRDHQEEELDKSINRSDRPVSSPKLVE